MNLRDYLRQDFHKYIRNRLIKDKCDFCGSIESLHLHHIDRFHNLLMDTLEELQLNELDTNDYTEREFQDICNYMLAKQIKCDYKTLCENCHSKIHFEEIKTDEYKAFYYNPYGKYIYVDIDKMLEMKISLVDIFHYIYVGTFLKFNNNVLCIKQENGRFKNINESELKQLLNLAESAYYYFKKEMIKNNLLIFNQDSIEINWNFIKMGYLKDINKHIRVFIDNYQTWYKLNHNRQYKICSKILLLLPYREDNIIYKTKKDIYEILECTNNDYLHRFIVNINKTFSNDIFVNIDKNKYCINPSIFYDGGLDKSLKQLENTFKSNCTK